MDTVEYRVKQVTGHVLKLDPARIKSGDNFAADLGAESIQSVELVAMFEEEFGVDLDEDTALAVDTVSGAVDFIGRACKDQGAPH